MAIDFGSTVSTMGWQLYERKSDEQTIPVADTMQIRSFPTKIIEKNRNLNLAGLERDLYADDDGKERALDHRQIVIVSENDMYPKCDITGSYKVPLLYEARAVPGTASKMAFSWKRPMTLFSGTA